MYGEHCGVVGPRENWQTHAIRSAELAALLSKTFPRGILHPGLLVLIFKRSQKLGF